MFRTPEVLRRELGVASFHPVVGIVGIVGYPQRWKGRQLAVEAVILLRASFPELACVIVGNLAETEDDRRFADELCAFIEFSRLAQSVVIAGYRPDVANYMNAHGVHDVYRALLPASGQSRGTG